MACFANKLKIDSQFDGDKTLASQKSNVASINLIYFNYMYLNVLMTTKMPFVFNHDVQHGMLG
jgi:hypothetical protein